MISFRGFAILALILGVWVMTGCSSEEQPEQTKKFEGSMPPPGFIEERMKNRSGNGAPEGGSQAGASGSNSASPGSTTAGN